MTSDTSHQCPGPGCTARVPHSQLACRHHWFQVPANLRRWVILSYRRDADAHRDAVLSAIDTMH